MATLKLWSNDEVDVNLDIDLTVNGQDTNINTTISHYLDDHVEVDLHDRDILDALDEESCDLDFLYEWMEDQELALDFITYITKNDYGEIEDIQQLIDLLTEHKAKREEQANAVPA